MRISDWSSDVCSSDLENGVRLSYKNVDAEGGLPFLRANHLIDFSDQLRIGAGEASDHGFGFVELQPQRTDDIPVPIDHALTLPPQIAAPLQPLTQAFAHLRHPRRRHAILNFKDL